LNKINDHFYDIAVQFCAAMPLTALSVSAEGADFIGNTAQLAANAFAAHLLADFPSSYTKTPCHTPVCLRRFYAT